MNCADVHRALPEIDDGILNAEFEAHLKSCPSCSALVSDLEAISSEALQLAESEEPSPKLWLRIADELRAEGLIREPVTESRRPVLVVSKRRSWNAWWLIPVTAVLIVGGVYVLKPKPAGDIAQQPPVSQPQTQTASNQQSKSASSLEKQLSAPSAASAQERQAEDQQFLDEVSQSAPMMKAAYENELRSVNSYIDDARAYAQQNPDDEDARRHLLEAYEQKQMLYQMALSNIQ